MNNSTGKMVSTFKDNTIFLSTIVDVLRCTVTSPTMFSVIFNSLGRIVITFPSFCISTSGITISPNSRTVPMLNEKFLISNVT